MGVYGTTYKSAFSGLGKPSIKLEFEDNDQLLAFQRRIDGGADGEEQGGAAYDPELANYDQKRLDEAVANHNTIGWGMSDELRDGWTRLHSDAAPKDYDVMIKGTRPALRLGTYGWEFQSSTDAQLVPKEKGLKAHKGGELEGTIADEETRKYDFYLMLMSDVEPINAQKFTPQILSDYDRDHNDFKVNTPIGEVIVKRELIFGKDKHLLKHIFPYFNVLKRTLEDPTCIFHSKDGNGFKNKTFAKCFYLDGIRLLSIVSPVKPGTLELKTTYPTDKKRRYLNNYDEVWELVKRGGEKIIYSKPSINDLHGLGNPQILKSSFKIVEFRLPMTITENGAKSFNFNENSLGAPGDVYLVTDTRTKPRKDLDDVTALKKYDIRKLTGEELQKMQADDPLLYEQIKSDLQQKTHMKQDVKTKEDWMQEVDEMLEAWKKEAFYKTTPQKLDEPASRVQARYISNLRDIIIKYFIEEIDKGNYERVSNIANILGYKYTHNERIAQTNGLISQFVGIVPTLPEGWRISKNIPKWLPKLPKGFVYIDNGKEMFDYRHKIMPTQKGLGKTANDALYNNNDIIETRGLKPTYKILQSYDAFFAPAQHSQTFAGVGLDDTKKLIADICKAHYKDCARIAQHLKGDTKLQSVFNLWHWLRHNIRYEYDREGREEVRTPLRTWADRRRGVDCDCLSVFAWCVLKCMGYNPAFELAAFRNKPAYSHIYINLDGIVVDRVWYVFNSRPPGVTKTELFRVGMLDNLGQLF